MSTFERVEEAAAAVRSRCGALPQIAIVLGSGLGDFADTLGDAVATPYTELPHWPASKVIGHAGRLVVGTVAGKRIAALAGRVHFYEGHDLATVVFADARDGPPRREAADPDQRRRRHQHAASPRAR